MVKKRVIGILYSGRIGKEEKIFQELAKKKNLELILLNIHNSINEQFLQKVKCCDLIYNDSAEDFAIEVIKTIERMGKKVVENSRLYYYLEDKWLFYLLCKEHHFPTLNTILLSEHLPTAKKELKEFKQWPVVLKRVMGTQGEYVDKADNLSQAEKIIKLFWKKGAEKLPIIAQEFVLSPSYRVTAINQEVIQTVVKTSNNWKATGSYIKDKNTHKFKVDKELKEILQKMFRTVKIKIVGFDFLKKEGRWLILEANAEPAFNFINDEQKKIINGVLNFLKKEC